MSWTGLSAGWWLVHALQSVALFVLTTLVFDSTHYALHRLKDSHWRLLRRLGGLHQAHHDFCDRCLVYHDSGVMANLVKHVLPEYATQMAVCALGFAILHPVSVGAVMLVFTVIFFHVLIQRGKDGHHSATEALAPRMGRCWCRRLTTHSTTSTPTIFSDRTRPCSIVWWAVPARCGAAVSR